MKEGFKSENGLFKQAVINDKRNVVLIKKEKNYSILNNATIQRTVHR